MMNVGRQQMDEAEHAREQELQQRVDDLQKDVGQLETTLGGGIESASSSSVARSKRPYLKTSDCSSVVSDGENSAIFLIA